MASVEVILKDKIASLGAEGDVVKVKAGFARNFLVPQGKAFTASKGNLRQLESLKKVRAEREAKEIEEAEKTALKLKRLKLKLTLTPKHCLIQKLSRTRKTFAISKTGVAGPMKKMECCAIRHLLYNLSKQLGEKPHMRSTHRR